MHQKILNIEIGSLVTGCVTGAKHIEDGKPCQDSSIASVQYYKGEPYALIAVADGHGSNKYSRSEIGAHFAVQAAIAATSDWVAIAETYKAFEPGSWLKNAESQFDLPFSNNLKQYWNEKVDKHLKDNPAQEGELVEGIEAYGTTIALAVIYEGQVFLGAIGDSSVFVILNDEQVLNVINGSEEGPLGLSTHSLVQKKAAANWKRMRVSIDNLKMVCAVTDGFTDSLGSIPHTLVSLSETTQSKGLEWLENAIQEFLEHLTDKGVGDDIASVFYFPPWTNEENSGEIDR